VNDEEKRRKDSFCLFCISCSLSFSFPFDTRFWATLRLPSGRFLRENSSSFFYEHTVHIPCRQCSAERKRKPATRTAVFIIFSVRFIVLTRINFASFYLEDFINAMITFAIVNWPRYVNVTVWKWHSRHIIGSFESARRSFTARCHRPVHRRVRSRF